MHALEDLREGLAFLEVLAVVVRRAGGGFAAQPHGVGGVDEHGVRPTDGPAGANGKGRIEPSFDLAQLEADGARVGAGAQGDGHGQQARAEGR
ncbi:hypothetical protein D9M68_824870 [compost metagenome]